MSSLKHGEEFKKQISDIIYEIYSLVSIARGQCNTSDAKQLLDTTLEISSKASIAANLTRDWKMKKILSGT